MCKRVCEVEEHVYATVVNTDAIIVWRYQALDILGTAERRCLAPAQLGDGRQL